MIFKKLQRLNSGHISGTNAKYAASLWYNIKLLSLTSFEVLIIISGLTLYPPINFDSKVYLSVEFFRASYISSLLL